MLTENVECVILDMLILNLTCKICLCLHVCGVLCCVVYYPVDCYHTIYVVCYVIYTVHCEHYKHVLTLYTTHIIGLVCIAISMFY